jgi:hypothetical protein
VDDHPLVTVNGPETNPVARLESKSMKAARDAVRGAQKFRPA